MPELNEKSKKKLKKAIEDGKVTDETSLGIFQMILDMEDGLETLREEVNVAIKKVKEGEINLGEVLKSVVGKPGEPGAKGDSYILTPKDKKEIAKLIEVPIVEKVIEKTEVIRETPIEITKVTNEVKEVALPIQAKELRDKLETLKDDDRFDISFVKGIDKVLATEVQFLKDWSIQILDQRTSFLIQKVSNLSDKVNSQTTGTGGGHVIQDEGTPLAQRVNLNFAGAGVTVTDDPGNNATKVTISGTAGSGITDINTDTTASQTLTVGTTGIDFAIVDNGTGDHKFNLPSASATARGVVTTGAQTIAGAKTFSSTIVGNISGNAATATALATPRNIAITGDLTWNVNFDGSGNVTAAGTLATVNSNVGTFGSATQVAQVTVNAKGLTTAVTNVAITPAASSITGGAALTKTDDTNVTLTLGGSPTTALLAATSLTLGWTGTLAVTRGGTGTGTAFTQGSVIFAGASGVYTQDNANFFYDATNHRLILGTTSAGTRFTVSEQATIQTAVSGSTAQFVGTDANPLRITFDTHNNSSSSGTALMFRRSRGTSTTPAALSAGDVLASLNARGYGTSQYAAASTGVLSWKANEAFTNTANGTYLSIDTTPDGSVTAAELARFNGIGLGIGATPVVKLQINQTSGFGTITPGNTGAVAIDTIAAVYSVITTPWTDIPFQAFGSIIDLTTTGTKNNKIALGLNAVVTTTTSDAGNWTGVSRLTGGAYQASHEGAGTMNAVWGANFIINRNTTANVSDMSGIVITSSQGAASTSGTVAALKMISITRPVGVSGMTFTANYGLWIDQQHPAAGTVTNTYSYGIFHVGGSSDLNYLGSTLKIGNATAVRGTTEGTLHIDLFNGTAPVGTLSNGASFYCASGEMWVIDSAGNALQISPHDEEGNWWFNSKNTATGKKVIIDVEKLLRKLNDRFGYDYVHDLME